MCVCSFPVGARQVYLSFPGIEQDLRPQVQEHVLACTLRAEVGDIL